MELLTAFLAGQRQFGARVQAVDESQWTAPTPAAEWSVSDLVEHLIDEHRWLPPLLHGLDLESAGKVVEGTRDLPVDGGVGANLAESWEEAVVGSAAAVNEPGALDRTVDLSSGATAVSDYLAEMTFDLVVHSWDLGRAIGFADPLPAELVEFGLKWVRQAGELSASSLFDEPVAVPDNAPPLVQLVALTGRDPAWRSGSAG
jgi:uncharacterized protein (TIGR03086 family)